MKSLLTRLRSLSEAPNNFIALTPAEARVLVEAIEAAKKLSECVTWCEEEDESVSGYISERNDVALEALAQLEKEPE